ncbi:MAG: hypothetical protein DMG97_15965 [Acidobacteria bacterium]|nr:MAG: hypothetical protein DMG98_05085 [Acidobacteriota bacterium]PYV71532.1 MAG: hypothetical protein DMG97_15965 [Acidobacteriota bacterium]PYV76568.1 MAG: hypothetical protein DMG96_13685 [Acidobacteriota bacterium]
MMFSEVTKSQTKTRIIPDNTLPVGDLARAESRAIMLRSNEHVLQESQFAPAGLLAAVFGLPTATLGSPSFAFSSQPLR